MKKIQNLGKALSKAEQKNIKGGQFIMEECLLIAICPAGYNAIANPIDESVKCCSHTIDCCYGVRCDGSTFAWGSGCGSGGSGGGPGVGSAG